MSLALIGGTGLYRMAGLAALEQQSLTTPYGPVTVTVGQLPGTSSSAASERTLYF